MQKVSLARALTPDEREALIASVEMQLTKSPRDMASINRLVSEFIQVRSSRPVPGNMAPQSQT